MGGALSRFLASCGSVRLVVGIKRGVFCDSACSHNAPRSDFMEESQAMRYILAVIKVNG